MMNVELKVPNKYKKYYDYLELNIYDEYDENKYILHYAKGYAYMGEYPVWYVKSKKEALEYLKLAEIEKG